MTRWCMRPTFATLPWISRSNVFLRFKPFSLIEWWSRWLALHFSIDVWEDRLFDLWRWNEVNLSILPFFWDKYTEGKPKVTVCTFHSQMRFGVSICLLSNCMVERPLLSHSLWLSQSPRSYLSWCVTWRCSRTDRFLLGLLEMVRGALDVSARSFGIDSGFRETHHTPKINYELVVSFWHQPRNRSDDDVECESS